MDCFLSFLKYFCGEIRFPVLKICLYSSNRLHVHVDVLRTYIHVCMLRKNRVLLLDNIFTVSVSSCIIDGQNTRKKSIENGLTFIFSCNTVLVGPLLILMYYIVHYTPLFLSTHYSMPL